MSQPETIYHKNIEIHEPVTGCLHAWSNIRAPHTIHTLHELYGCQTQGHGRLM